MFSNNKELIAAYVYGIVSVIVCALATVLRFVATRRAGLKWVAEDLFALAASCFYIVTVTIYMKAIEVNNGEPLQKASQETISYFLKLYYALEPFTPLTQLCAKYSLLFLYHRLFGVHRNFARWVYFVGIVQGGLAIAVVLTRLFRCRPISKAWDLTQTGKCFIALPCLQYDAELITQQGVYSQITGNCYRTKAYLVSNETINSTVDFVMVILAVWMVQALQIRTSVKWRLCAIFALGGLSGVAGFLKIGEVYNTAGFTNYGIIVLWRLIQDSTSIICCCAPVYKNVLPRQSIARFVASVSSTITSRLLRIRPSQSSMPPLVPPAPTGPSAESDYSNTRKRNWTYFGTPIYKGNAWVDIDGSPSNAQEPSYPLRTIHVQRNIESV